MSASVSPPVPQPDYGRLDRVLRRSGEPDRVPFYEIFSNIEASVLKAIGDPALPGTRSILWPQSGVDLDLLTHVRHQYWLGYDYVSIRESMTGFVFPLAQRPHASTAEGERSYMTQSQSTISGRGDFERYPWPRVDSLDFSPFEKVVRILPQGMGVIGDSPGVFENVMWLLGYEGMAYMLADDEPLFREVVDTVGGRVAQYFDTMASFDCVRALRYGDDLGFKTQLLVPPDVFRRIVLPWHLRIVAMAHRRDKPIILHSCGNLSAVRQDIVATGWDARHSFEDVIEPVWEAKKRDGHRISHLGGFDMVKLSLMGEAEIRAHVRLLVERCAPGGGWALGSGNSIPEYVPVGNLLAMLDEGRRCGSYS